MKKKIFLWITVLCAAFMMGGCGSGKDEKDSQSGSDGATEEASGETTEEALGEEKDTSKTLIEYDPLDYVDLGEYKGLKISLGSYEVTDDAVKSEIESMLQSKPAYEDTDKKTVETGDFVNLDYEGLKDGVAFDGGTAQGYVLEIGSGTFIDGFEDGLIGKNVGDEAALNLTFPENYGNTELAGAAVVFNVKINKIVKKIDITYDTMTDEYVLSNFASQGYENIEALKSGVREQLEANNESSKETDIQNAVFDKLAETCTVKGFPDGLLEQNISDYKEQFEANLQSYGMTLEDYLKNYGTTEEEYNKQTEEVVKESLNNQLIIEAIAKKEGIEADEEGFAEYVKGVVAEYGYESEDAFLAQNGEEFVKNVYINNKALDMIKENAVITSGEQ